MIHEDFEQTNTIWSWVDNTADSYKWDVIELNNAVAGEFRRLM